MQNAIREEGRTANLEEITKIIDGITAYIKRVELQNNTQFRVIIDKLDNIQKDMNNAPFKPSGSRYGM